MILEELLQMWSEDTTLDHNEPGKELLKIPSFHAKYLKILVHHKLILKKKKDEMAVERKIRYNYYSGQYNTDKNMLSKLGLEPFKYILKSDIGTYIDTDEAIIKINDKIAYHSEMVSTCESIMGTLKNRTWELKAYIDWLRFQAGA